MSPWLRIGAGEAEKGSGGFDLAEPRSNLWFKKPRRRRRPVRRVRMTAYIR